MLDKDMEKQIKTGSVVAYKVCMEAGDADARFVVLDDYGDDSDRCKVQALNTNLPLAPTDVKLKSDLKVVATGEEVIESKLSDERFLTAIGHNIKAYRTKRKLTQEALAGKVGIDRSYLAGVESGKRNITMLSLKQIAEALGVSAGSLKKEKNKLPK